MLRPSSLAPADRCPVHVFGLQNRTADGTQACVTKQGASRVSLALSFFACRVQFIHSADVCRCINEEASVRKIERGGLTGSESCRTREAACEKPWQRNCLIATYVRREAISRQFLFTFYTVVCRFDTPLLCSVHHH